MARQNFEIDLGTILKNGAPCADVTIVWEEPSCGAITCILDEDGKIIHVQIPDGCTEKCFYGTLTCNDSDCTVCDPIPLTICPCELPTDCDICETCVDNLCISTCEEGEFCSEEDEICVECDDENPCPCNQICVSGTCTCPPGSPYEDEKGCCSDCNEANPCENCYYCTPEGCKPIVCPVGVCDPDSGECVDCNNTGDCTGDHECCVDHDCVCCEGFVRDPLTGDCVEAPDCTTDEDCPDCEICNASGECEPNEVPPGYVVGNPVDGCVLKECDCDNPDCPFGHTCFPYDVDTCYCRPCSGHCSDSEPCPPGCICQDEECVPNECFGPCDQNTPCPEGCGCVEGYCVPCSTLSCEDNCEEIPGCHCNGNDCEGSGCSGPCDELNPCPGEDCGCDTIEHQCVLCESVDCNNQTDCPVGCYCNGFTCVPNPCQYSTCEDPNDCGEGCTCIDGYCVPCALFSCVECANIPGCACTNTVCNDDNDNDCDDDLTLEKGANCTLVAELETESCCACPNIYAHVHSVYTTAADTIAITGFLRTGNAAGSPLLSTLNIENGLPTQGAITIAIRYKVVSVGQGIVGIIDGSNGILDFAGTDTAVGFTLSSVYDVGDTFSYGGEDWTVTEVCLIAYNSTIFEYENECRSDYGNKDLFCITSAANSTNDVSWLPKKLVRCKTPLFTLYRDDNTSFSSPVLIKRYADRVNATNYRIIYDSNDLEICEYYKVTSDCGCDTVQEYNCAE